MDLPSPSNKPRTPNRNHPPLTSLENKNDSLRSEQLLQKSNNNEKRAFAPITSASAATVVERKHLTGAPTVHSTVQTLSVVHDENAGPIIATNSPTATHATKKRDLFIPQTYKATKNRVERTCLRPTTGGKTVAAMKHLHNDKRPGNNNHHHTLGASGNIGGVNNISSSNYYNRNDTPHQRLSAEQLKLLSRRIDPSAPLQSPHSSPVKPALPSSFVTSSSSSLQLSSSTVSTQPQQHQPPQFQYATTTTDNTVGASDSNSNSNDNNNNNTSNVTNTGSNHAGSSSSASSSSSSTLYQTCMAIWANSPPSLGDLRHDNIKYLSELLKIRLCQAKARALASLGPQDPNASLLSKATKKHRVRLALKRHQAAPPNTRTVSGNGQRLRRLQQYQQQNHHHTLISSNNARSLQGEDVKQSQSLKTPKKRGSTAGGAGKKKNAGESKAKKTITTPKQTRRSRATPPLILEDGSRAFVCKSCGKKYKNRNGLAYHRDRCKQKEREDENQQQDELAEDDNDEEEQQTGDGVKCVCKKPTEDSGTMIQCDKCQTWQHLKCVGVDQKDIANDYACPYCVKKEAKAKSEREASAKPRRHSEIDEMEEEEDELAEDDEEMDGEQQQQQVQSQSTPAAPSASVSSDNDNDAVMEDGNVYEEEQLVTLNDDDYSGTESNEDEFTNADIHDMTNHYGATPDNNSMLFDMKLIDREQQPTIPLDNASASQLAPEWDDILFSQTPDNGLRQSTQEPWTKMSSSSHDENGFANWGFSDLSLLQPPSLLFSDNTMVDDDSSNLPPSSDLLPTDHPSSDLPLPTSPDPLWYQFANFEDDYQCEEAQ